MLECEVKWALESITMNKASGGDEIPGHKGGVICISEVIDISPGNLDSRLCFIQLGVSHDVLCI